MSFWEEASPIVKISIIGGGAAIAYLVLAMLINLPPYSENEEVTQQRGVQPGAAAPAE
jgi:hypothetical protein